MRERAVRPKLGTSPSATIPSPTPLDSGLRRNDEWGAGMTKGCREWRMSGYWSGLSRIGVRDMLSSQSPMPAGAGTPRYEKPELWFGTANWRGGFCHAPTRPQRGTSPSATIPSPTPHNRNIIETNSSVQVTNWIEGVYFSYKTIMPAGAGTPRYENGVGWWGRLGAVRATPAPPLDSGPVSGYGACFRSPE